MPLERIIIAGGGVAGWMAASILSRKIGRDFCEICVIDEGGDDRSLGYTSAAEPLLPATVEASALLGYDEDLLIAATRATFSLGTALSGWGRAGAGFVPFGDLGAPMGSVAFHQLVARRRAGGSETSLANYALGALCAQAGRIARPDPDDRSIHATLAYGLHVDTLAFAQAMHGDAAARGVVTRQGRIASVERGADGAVAALQLDDHAHVTGDLFVDCLGPQSLLGAGAATEDWSGWLPCNRIVSAARTDGGAPHAYTLVEAQRGGWRRSVPLRGRVAETIAYRAGAAADLPGATPCFPQRRTAPWQANCVAIGGAALMIDPIAGAPLHLAQSAILRLARLLPADREGLTEAAEYNRETGREMDRARDYAIAHYALNQRIGEPFWDAARTAPLPEPLAHKVALFDSCGRVPMLDGESYEEPAWVALFDALGRRARRHDALAHGLGDAAIDAHFEKLRMLMLQALANMPPHAAYLAAIGR